MQRCGWCEGFDLYRDYHDTEWGVPLKDSRALFELLLLEGAQAGLSWATILKKRAHYRLVFDGFDPVKMAQYDAAKTAELLADAGIVRHRGKVAAFVTNAQAYLKLQDNGIDFADFLWQFVEHQPQQNHWATLAELPTQTAASQAMSKALQQAGFKFVGATICYAFMQACGMVNDHVQSCWRYTAVQQAPA